MTFPQRSISADNPLTTFTQRSISGVVNPSDPVGEGLLVDLIAYYKFDDSGADDGGSGLDLTSGASPVYAAGKLGSAALLNGASPGTWSRTETAFNFAGDFTVQIWLYPTLSGGNQNVVGKANAAIFSSGSGWHFRKNPPNDLEFAYRTNNMALNSVINVNTAPLSMNTWYHAICTRTGGVIELFLNAVSQETSGTSSQSLAVSPQTTTFAVGRTSDGSFQYSGRVDEVAMWNRAITEEEIEWLYNGGTGKALPV